MNEILKALEAELNKHAKKLAKYPEPEGTPEEVLFWYRTERGRIHLYHEQTIRRIKTMIGHAKWVIKNTK